MTLAVILLLAGVVAGLARGGKLANIGRVDLKIPWSVFAGLGIQVISEAWAAFVDPGLRNRAGIAILVVSYGLLIAFVAANRRLPGAILIAAGLALNMIVIVANGAMPVSLSAAQAAGLDPSGAGFLATAVKHRLMDSQTVFWFLGDWIPVPVIRTVVSIGDMILGIGIFLLTERLIRYRPKRRKGPTGRGHDLRDEMALGVQDGSE